MRRIEIEQEGLQVETLQLELILLQVLALLEAVYLVLLILLDVDFVQHTRLPLLRLLNALQNVHSVLYEVFPREYSIHERKDLLCYRNVVVLGREVLPGKDEVPESVEDVEPVLFVLFGVDQEVEQLHVYFEGCVFAVVLQLTAHYLLEVHEQLKGEVFDQLYMVFDDIFDGLNGLGEVGAALEVLFLRKGE